MGFCFCLSGAYPAQHALGESYRLSSDFAEQVRSLLPHTHDRRVLLLLRLDSGVACMPWSWRRAPHMEWDYLRQLHALFQGEPPRMEWDYLLSSGS